MKAWLKKILAVLLLLLIVCGTAGWFYRHKISRFICEQAINMLEHKSGTDITYTSITAGFSALAVKNVTMVSPEFEITAKTLDIQYSSAILWRSSKIDFLKDISVNDFTVILKEDLYDARLTKKNKDAAFRHKDLANHILGHFNSVVRLNRGRIMFTVAKSNELLQVKSVSFLRSSDDNSLVFNMETGNEGFVSGGTVKGVFQPALPGFININAAVDVSLCGNKWQLQDVALKGKWDLDGALEFELDALAGEQTRLTASYSTNFLEEDISEFNVKASDFTLTVLPQPNRIYLSDSLMRILGKKVESVLTVNHITGTFGTDISVLWDPRYDKPQYNINVEVADTSLTYHSFPYSLKGLNGSVKVDNSRLDAHLKTTTEDNIDVKVTAAFADGDLDIRVTSPSMPTNRKLYQAIGQADKSGQVAWLAFAPKGYAAIDYHYWGKDGKEDYRLDIMPKGVSACYEEFTYPMYNVEGRLTLMDNLVLLENMSGTNRGGRVVLNGRIDNPGRSDMRVDLDFKCDDILLDKLLFDALPADVRKSLADVDIKGGSSDMTVKVSTTAAGELAYAVDMDAAAASVTYIPANITFNNARVATQFREDILVLESVKGFVNGQAVELKGKTGVDPHKGVTNYDIQFTAADADFEKLAAVFGDSQRKGSRLSGVVDFGGHLQGGGDEEAGFEMLIKCKSGVFELADYGVKLNNVVGVISVDKTKVDYNITADMAGSESCKVASRGILSAADISKGTINVEIAGAKTSDSFIPDELMLAPGGVLDLKLNNVIMNQGGLSCEKVVMNFNELGFEGDIVNRLNGNISGAIAFAGNTGLTVPQARLNIDSARIFDRPVERIIANFIFDRENGFKISNGLTAKFCDGDLSGAFVFKPAAGAASYELTLDFFDVDVNKLVQADAADLLSQQFNLEGRAAGQLYFKGVIGDKMSRLGRFGVDITNIKVADKTLADKILDAILDRSPAHTMQRLKVDAYLRQDKILIEDIRVLLPLMAMKGSGDIELDTRNINMLLTAQGLDIDNKYPFSDLSFLKAIGKTIAKVEVSGDIMDPKVTVTTLGLIRK